MTVGVTVIPWARNLARDPRPRTLAYVTVGGDVMPAPPLLVNDRSYVGGRSIYVTLPPGSWVQWLSGPPGSIGGQTTGIARTFAVAARVSGVSTLPRPSVFLHYDDALGPTYGPTLEGVPGTTEFAFARIDPLPATSDPARTLSRVSLFVGNPDNVPNPAPISFYLGGLDIREGVAVDRYVDGDQGEGFAWEGTPHDSPSVRQAATISPVRGFGGQIKPTPSLYLVDRQNRILDDLSKHFRSGEVSYNLDNDGSKGSARIVTDRRDLIVPLSDTYFRPHLTIDHPDGRRVEGSLGLFGASWPRETYGNAERRWAYEGTDLLTVLTQTPVLLGYLLGSGFDYRAMMLLVLRDAGFAAPANVDLADPPGLERAPAPFGIGVGGSVLELLNQIADGVAWTRPVASRIGKVTSGPIVPIDRRPVAVRYASGRHTLLRLPFEVEPQPGEMGNIVAVQGVRVIRLRHRPALSQRIRAVVTNTNPAHPLSHQRLGRYIQLPPINAGLVASQAHAEALGRAAIERAGMLPVRATLRTGPDIRELGEVYELAVDDPATGEPIPSGHGRFECRGWSLSLSGDYEMSHELRRVVPLEGLV